MHMATATLVAEPLEIHVSDPSGHQRVTLRNVRRTATAADIVAMATSTLKLPEIPFDLRHDRTSRLIESDKIVSELAEEQAPHLEVSLQPDAGLA
jgi:hypothetical protein